MDLYVSLTKYSFVLKLIAVNSFFFIADDMSMFNSDNALAHGIHYLLVMGSHNDGGTGSVNFFKNFHNIPTGFRVQVARGLVGNNQQGIINNSSGNSDTLLFATTQLIGISIGAVAQAYQIQHI